ncbi:hypothetical protein RB614_04875 [Phytohabitans sp. ZYX-F-186]|uniref:Uncharacterized protein n=1 Tax=Phytohabitans maris TaxID=3071409 RepID=A0ABU0Z9W7_9ACTN|nr:hypothetical protein [Phytohabitans sp. ZYX-F-186]MDQ7903852.1 hypothetical protein [Phytohabitans sp. ZYX-F-186]
MSTLASFVRPVNHEKTSVGQLSLVSRPHGPAEPATTVDSTGFLLIAAALLAAAVALMSSAMKPVVQMFREVLRSLAQAAGALFLAGAALVVVVISLLR